MHSMAHGLAAMALRAMRAAALGILAGWLVFPASAAAATCTWRGDGSDARWSVSGNWSGCVAPASGDTLVFPAGAAPRSTNDLEGLTLTAIQIAGDAAGASYLIDGLGVTVSSVLSMTGFGLDGKFSTLALPIALRPGFVTFDVPSARALTITGRITGADDSALSKTGGGTLELTHAASAWSVLEMFDGAVAQRAAGALPAALRVHMLASTARLLLGNFDTTIHELRSGDFEGANFGQISVGSRTLTITGDGVFSGLILGDGQIVKAGAGAMLLTGPFVQRFDGTLTVNSGTLSLGRAAAAVSVIRRVVVNDGIFRLTQPDLLSPNAAVTIARPGLFALADLADTTLGSLEGEGRVLLGAAGLTVGANNSSATFDGTIAGLMSTLNRVSLHKVGSGTVTLTGAHTYQGSTRIEGGTLVVNGSLTTSTTIELFGGTLAGSGTVGGIYAPVGSISPGASPGVLKAQTALLSGRLIVELNGPLPGSGYDQLRLAQQPLNLAGAAALQVSRGFSPPVGTSFTIVAPPSAIAPPTTGVFTGLPEGAQLVIDGQRFAISYRQGVTLTAIEPPPELRIDDVTIVEQDSGTSEARFTVTLSRPLDETITVQYATADLTAVAGEDYTAQSGTLVFLPGITTRAILVPVHGDRTVELEEAFLVRLFDLAGPGGRALAAVTRAEGRATIATDDAARTYYLSEGATGSFFDEDILIANPNDVAAPVTLTFLTDTGEQVVATRHVSARSHVTVHVDLLPGLAAATASVEITSEAGVPLLVERTMFWDHTRHAGHTSAAVERPSSTWLFAEGAQGFFDTFVLVANPHPTATDVTFTFLPQTGAPIVVSRTIGPTARLTLPVGELLALAGQSFGLTVQATQPILAERAMYFGATAAHPWTGGTASAGVTSAATRWFLAEGATGAFFDTFVLLSNPQDVPANVEVTYLLDAGLPITTQKVVPARGRLTIEIEAEADPRLRFGAVSTVVTSDLPIVAERSMYWAAPWHEAHNSFGVVELGTRWGLAEGRVGGAAGFHTYILLANPQRVAAQVSVTYLREQGEPLVRQYTVPPASRFTIDVNAIVPEMQDEAFGALIEATNDVAIAVERSMYWDAAGLIWSGGTNATGLRLTAPFQSIRDAGDETGRR